MRLAFYTRGDSLLGLGHVTRCLALARLARSEIGWEADFVLGSGREAHELVAAARFPHFDRARLTELPPYDALVVDELEVDPRLLRSLRPRCKVLVSLDDIGPGHHVADLAVNALYRCRAPRPSGAAGVSRAGLDFLILSPSFAATSYDVRTSPRALLLTQGGSDTHGLTPLLVQDLASWLRRNPDMDLHVHTGPAFKFDAELGAVLATLEGRRVTRHRQIDDMAAFMARMDVAISAGGMTACELAAIGVPTILVTGEEKELETVAALATSGAALSAGFYTTAAGAIIQLHLDRLIAELPLRRSLSVAARRSVDGEGARRILAELHAALASGRHTEPDGGPHGVCDTSGEA